MPTISTSDKIFATVINASGTVLRLTLDGMSSLQQVYATVRRTLTGIASGIVTLIIRNGSNGWTERRLMRTAPLPEAVQLTLF